MSDSQNPPDESEDLEEKKEQMRKYMAFERALHDKKSRRSGGGSRGCTGCFLKVALVGLCVTLLVFAIRAWHPWGYEVVEGKVDPGSDLCPDSASGHYSERYLTVLGVRITRLGESTICVEDEPGTKPRSRPRTR